MTDFMLTLLCFVFYGTYEGVFQNLLKTYFLYIQKSIKDKNGDTNYDKKVKTLHKSIHNNKNKNNFSTTKK